MRMYLSLGSCLLGSALLCGLAAAAETPSAPAKALLDVRIPDPYGVLYVDGKKTESRGESILLETPVLEAGKENIYHLRAAFRSGDRLLIQDRTVQVYPGRTTTVAFDGKDARSAPLPSTNPAPPGYEMLPYPRPATDKDARQSN
jgi:uncharacterized protein (TIGR03000 family)